LLRWRDGTTQPVALRLPVLGDYAPTAPFDCPKTQRIVQRAAEVVARHMPPEGYSGMTGAINGLFLLGCGDDRYLDHVRRTACRMAYEPFSDGGHNTWRWGYVNLFLCEYSLATGDARVLPRIGEYSDRMAKGQCNPGTWGHKSVDDRIPPGYGSMNQAGLVAFLSLAAARQCGVPFDRSAIANSISFYGGYAGRGGIPYGDHPPEVDAACNGKNGSAAVVFHVLGADPAAQWFARLCASANLGAFEGGHTGNFFNQLWTPLGVAISGRENTVDFWARFNSYRDLARRWDGTFMTQPLPHHREGDLSTGNYVRSGPGWSTAAFALSYLVSNNSLAILGRTRSVFGADAPQTLKPALDLYARKQYADCQQSLQALMESRDPVEKALAAQLHAAAGRNLRSLALTLDNMRGRLEAGDLFPLRAQVLALESVVDRGDARPTPFQNAIGSPDNADTMRLGEQFYGLIGGFSYVGMEGFIFFAPRPHLPTDRRARDGLAALASGPEGYYRKQAEAMLAACPEKPEPSRVELVDNLVADHQTVTQLFRVAAPEKITELLLTWDLNVGGGMRILLNGKTIMDMSIDPGRWRTARNTCVPLTPSTRELLKAGENELAVEWHGDRIVTEASCKLEALVAP